MKKLLCLFLFAFLVLSSFAASASQEEISNYPIRTLDQIQSFENQIVKESQELKQKLVTKYDGKEKKIKKNADMCAYDLLIQATSNLKEMVRKEGKTPKLKHKFVQIQRLHYSLLADIGKTSKSNIFDKLKGHLVMATNLGAGHLKVQIPDVYAPNKAIGPRKAAKEASRLFKKGSSIPLTREQISKLSPIEISRLEPDPKHPAISGKPANKFNSFISYIQKSVRMQKKKLARFDFSYATHLMFYKGLKSSATSPKITAKDRYGNKWKVKWGDEVHTDVAATRLYIDLGGTYTDQKFYSGTGELILVLDPPTKNGKDSVKTFYQLADKLLKSTYKFHAYRYLLPKPVLKDSNGKILGTGKVDKTMIERESIDKKYLGSYYVKFKECQLSFYNPAIKRLGGIALSKLGAENDRVARSSLVFNAWIKNKDMKDDNSRAGILFNTKTGRFDKSVEYQSDLGATMGALRPSGELNSFEKSFIIHLTSSITFRMHPLYIPKAWKECTWSDARWMALRIAKLSRSDIESCFADSGWPIFCQKIAVEKLISRRNELVKAFMLEKDGIKIIPCNPNFTYKRGKDIIVKNGKINENSKTVKELVKRIHPEGLAKVIPRSKD